MQHTYDLYKSKIAKDPKYKPKNFDEYLISIEQPLKFNCVIPIKPIALEGFQIHVSAKRHTALSIFLAVEPILIRMKSPYRFFAHQYSGSLEYLDFINQHYLDQRGKFITIYPKDIQEAQQIAIALDKELIKFPQSDFITIPSDYALGDSGGLYTRFGPYPGGYIQHPKLVKSPKDECEGPWKPDHLDNPFENIKFESRIELNQQKILPEKEVIPVLSVTSNNQLASEYPNRIPFINTAADCPNTNEALQIWQTYNAHDTDTHLFKDSKGRAWRVLTHSKFSHPVRPGKELIQLNPIKGSKIEDNIVCYYGIFHEDLPKEDHAHMELIQHICNPNGTETIRNLSDSWHPFDYRMRQILRSQNS